MPISPFSFSDNIIPPRDQSHRLASTDRRWPVESGYRITSVFFSKCLEAEPGPGGRRDPTHSCANYDLAATACQSGLSVDVNVDDEFRRGRNRDDLKLKGVASLGEVDRDHITLMSAEARHARNAPAFGEWRRAQHESGRASPLAKFRGRCSRGRELASESAAPCP